MLNAQPSLYDLAEGGVLCARVRGRSTTVGNSDILCTIDIDKVTPIDFAVSIPPKLKRRP